MSNSSFGKMTRNHITLAKARKFLRKTEKKWKSSDYGRIIKKRHLVNTSLKGYRGAKSLQKIHFTSPIFAILARHLVKKCSRPVATCQEKGDFVPIPAWFCHFRILVSCQVVSAFIKHDVFRVLTRWNPFRRGVENIDPWTPEGKLRVWGLEVAMSDWNNGGISVSFGFMYFLSNTLLRFV